MKSPIAPAGASLPPSQYRSPHPAGARRLTPEERDQIDPRIREAAEGMEAVFLDYLMKTMRETVPKNDMDLENSGTRIYRAMLDSELAEKSAKQGGIGLADEIIAYLQRQQYNKDGVSTPAASTGGTNASRPARK